MLLFWLILLFVQIDYEQLNVSWHSNKGWIQLIFIEPQQSSWNPSKYQKMKLCVGDGVTIQKLEDRIIAEGRDGIT